MSAAQPLPIDDAVGRAALRKAGLRLIPLFALGYGIAYMDRVNISFASLQMNRDLHFSATVYGFGAGVFFLSYAGCNVPANLLLLRLGARRYVSTFTGSEDTGIWLQVELAGLAGVGSASDTSLSEEIRGYTPADANTQRIGAP